MTSISSANSKEQAPEGISTSKKEPAPSSSPTTGSNQQDCLTWMWSNPYAMAPIYTGTLGTGLGVTVGALRGQSKLLFGLHMGIGYGIFGGVYSGTLYAVRQVREKDDVANWMAAGAASGAVTSLITGGPQKMPVGALVFGGLGVVIRYVCQSVDESVQAYKERRAEQLFNSKPAAARGGSTKPWARPT